MKSVIKLCVVLMVVMSMSVYATTIAQWDFEDGVAGATFASVGGSLDTVAGVPMYGYNDYYGPSFAAYTPDGSSLSLRAADYHQDGYTTDATLNSWAPETWTIECTVLMKDLAGWNTIIGRDGSIGGPESDFYLQNNGIDDHWRVNFNTASGNRVVIDADSYVGINQWVGIAVTSDGTNVKMYLNTDATGYVEVGSAVMAGATTADNALATTGANWTFMRGWYNGGFGDNCDGYMDNVRFSDVALAPEELMPLTIPEPATMALLALGSLVVFRKRN